MRHALQMLRLGLLFLSHVAVAFTIVEPMTVCHAVKVDGTYEFSFVSHDDRLSEKLHARPFGARYGGYPAPRLASCGASRRAADRQLGWLSMARFPVDTRRNIPRRDPLSRCARMRSTV